MEDDTTIKEQIAMMTRLRDLAGFDWQEESQYNIDAIITSLTAHITCLDRIELEFRRAENAFAKLAECRDELERVKKERDSLLLSLERMGMQR